MEAGPSRLRLSAFRIEEPIQDRQQVKAAQYPDKYIDDSSEAIKKRKGTMDGGPLPLEKSPRDSQRQQNIKPFTHFQL